jgi:hypothetical protein
MSHRQHAMMNANSTWFSLIRPQAVFARGLGIPYRCFEVSVSVRPCQRGAVKCVD